MCGSVPRLCHAVNAWPQAPREPESRLSAQLHASVVKPKGASSINQVERFFAELATGLLRRGVHRSALEPEHSIRQYIDNPKPNPRPFVWFKTADQVWAGTLR